MLRWISISFRGINPGFILRLSYLFFRRKKISSGLSFFIFMPSIQGYILTILMMFLFLYCYWDYFLRFRFNHDIFLTRNLMLTLQHLKTLQRINILQTLPINFSLRFFPIRHFRNPTGNQLMINFLYNKITLFLLYYKKYLLVYCYAWTFLTKYLKIIKRKYCGIPL